MGFAMVTRGGVTTFSSGLLEQVATVRHSFSTRVGGVSPEPHNTLNLGFTSEDTAENIATNWSRYLASSGFSGHIVHRLSQTHSSTVLELTFDESHSGGRAPPSTDFATEPIHLEGEGDSLVAGEAGHAVTVLTADCVPVLIAVGNPARMVAAVHAGWRGIVGGILRKTLDTMGESLGSRLAPQDVTVAIGPHVRTCCFEVGNEVVDQFARVGLGDAVLLGIDFISKSRISLLSAIRLQLLQFGIPESRIDCSNLCTRCKPDLFFSHRRDGTRRGTMASVIGLSPE